MTQPGYQEGSEQMWWWKVAMHLDSAQLASVNAMAHNLDDQTPVHALQDKLREAQAILLEIFRWKGLLPGFANAVAEAATAPTVEMLESSPAAKAEESAVDVQVVTQEPVVISQDSAIQVSDVPKMEKTEA